MLVFTGCCLMEDRVALETLRRGICGQTGIFHTICIAQLFQFAVFTGHLGPGRHDNGIRGDIPPACRIPSMRKFLSHVNDFYNFFHIQNRMTMLSFVSFFKSFVFESLHPTGCVKISSTRPTVYRITILF